MQGCVALPEAIEAAHGHQEFIRPRVVGKDVSLRLDELGQSRIFDGRKKIRFIVRAGLETFEQLIGGLLRTSPNELRMIMRYRNQSLPCQFDPRSWCIGGKAKGLSCWCWLANSRSSSATSR
jgi:hypothetical protein